MTFRTAPRQSIFILIDTQGTGCVGCYAKNPNLGTPHIDALAANGIRFDRAYTCSPVCGPARSAIFTGLFPHSNGVLGNDIAPQASLPTLGQRLSDAGVRTAYIGKWHLDGSDYFGNGVCPKGWDPEYWFDGRNYLDSLPDQEARDISRHVLGPEEIARHGITSEFTHAHRTVDRARDFIARHKHEEFFLVVSIDEPHHPFICPEPFVSAFDEMQIPVPSAEDSLTDKPLAQREWAENTRAHNPDGLVRDEQQIFTRDPRYFACNSYCDHQVGRLVDAIDREIPEAMVVYTADHGVMFGHHGGLIGKGPAMYEEITNIPWIVRWPGRTAKGSISRALASHIDLVPTFLDFFSQPVPDLLEGRSLLNAFADPAMLPNEAIFVEFNRYEVDHDGFGAFAPIRCVFDGRYKLAVNLLDTDELYDLEIDPHELVNLIGAATHAEVRDRLHDRLLEWMGATRDPLRGPHWGRRPWRRLVGSSWGGPTRPRPFDESYYPQTLLYSTGKVIEHRIYERL